MTLREPVIHSHVTDVLPDEHPLAAQAVYCEVCQGILHCSPNECMTTWVETGVGNYCIECFVKLTNGVVEDEFGLPPAVG